MGWCESGAVLSLKIRNGDFTSRSAFRLAISAAVDRQSPSVPAQTMAKIKVHAGDFLKGEGQLSFGSFVLKTQAHPRVGETISLTKLEMVDTASEENVKKVGGTIGWGAAGAVLLGPVGLLAGLLLGGRKKEVTFVAKFKDGRKLLATTDSGTYTQIRAAVF